MAPATRISINSDVDIVSARQQGRTIATELGFSSTDQALIATAISEVARNIVEFAQCGEILFETLNHESKCGIQIIAHDNGPGIENIPLALQDGYSTRKSLGVGLPGARRLMDEFDIVSQTGKGTTITMKKWVRSG